MTTPERPVTVTDYRRIVALAAASVVTAGMLEYVRVFVPPARAPRVPVRWTEGVTDASRQDLEQRLSLMRGERRDAATWEYDLGDPSEPGIRALLADPSVADTHYIDRERATLATDVPRGVTVIAGSRLALWRESPVFGPLRMLSMSIALISAVWLVTDGRAARK